MPMNDGDSISFAREPSVWEKLRERAIYKVVILGEAGVGKTSLLASTQTEGIPDDFRYGTGCGFRGWETCIRVSGKAGIQRNRRRHLQADGRCGKEDRA